MRTNSRIALVAAALPALLAVLSCSRKEAPTPGVARGGEPVTLILAGYTTPREAYGKAVIPAFQKM